jgi:hypothetical protein
MFSVTQTLNQEEVGLRTNIVAQKAPNHFNGFRSTSIV